jgi:hypothetical protein
MSKVLSVIEAVFASVAAFAKANPALAAGVVSVAVSLLAKFGLHVTYAQFVALLTSLSAILAGLVHVATMPAGRHEKETREARGDVLLNPEN